MVKRLGKSVLPEAEWQHTPDHRAARAALENPPGKAAADDAAIVTSASTFPSSTTAADAPVAAEVPTAAVPVACAAAAAVPGIVAAPTNLPLADLPEEDLQALDRLFKLMDHLKAGRPELDEPQRHSSYAETAVMRARTAPAPTPAAAPVRDACVPAPVFAPEEHAGPAMSHGQPGGRQG